MNLDSPDELPEWAKLVLAVLSGEWTWEDEAQHRHDVVEQRKRYFLEKDDPRKLY